MESCQGSIIKYSNAFYVGSSWWWTWSSESMFEIISAISLSCTPLASKCVFPTMNPSHQRSSLQSSNLVFTLQTVSLCYWGFQILQGYYLGYLFVRINPSQIFVDTICAPRQWLYFMVKQYPAALWTEQWHPGWMMILEKRSSHNLCIMSESPLSSVGTIFGRQWPQLWFQCLIL